MRRPVMIRTPMALLTAALLCVPMTAASADTGSALPRHLVAYYDFDHPVPGDPAMERDLGRSGTRIDLVNGGAAMRVRDRAHPGSRNAIQTRQVNPAVLGNDDWKAGTYATGGV